MLGKERINDVTRLVVMEHVLNGESLIKSTVQYNLCSAAGWIFAICILLEYSEGDFLQCWIT